MSDQVALSLTVLGCDGSYPGVAGACSGYLVSDQKTSVWLDAGTGTLAQLQRYVAIEDLDAIVISHSHLDHWSDLEHFAIACRYVIGRRGVPVYAPEGLAALMRPDNHQGTLAFSPIADGQKVSIGAMRWTFSRTDHPVDTLAARIEAGQASVGYSADTGPGWRLASLGPGMDLTLCEATVLADREGKVPHLSARQAGESAKESGTRRLVITHVGPRVDHRAAQAEAEASFGGPVTVAAIGDRYDVVPSTDVVPLNTGRNHEPAG